MGEQPRPELFLLTVLDARWRALWSRLGASGPADPVRAEIEAAYGMPGRHYHNIGHLERTLGHLDDLSAHADDPDIAELALWMHDVVWEPLATDCEARSAAWAVERLVPAGVPAALLDRMTRLVLATTHPAHGPADADEAVVRDADLAILAADPVEFDEYDRAVRREHAAVPGPEYRAGRSRVLRGFLERPELYFTAPMKALEPRARANLGRALKRLDIPS